MKTPTRTQHEFGEQDPMPTTRAKTIRARPSKIKTAPLLTASTEAIYGKV